MLARVPKPEERQLERSECYFLLQNSRKLFPLLDFHKLMYH